MKYAQFAVQFNEFRLKSGFESLADFGKALANEGYAYEDSTFSRWKNGTRIPKHPRVVAAIVKIFVEHQAIQNKEQIANIYCSVNLPIPHYLNFFPSTNESGTELCQYLMQQILGATFLKLHSPSLKYLEPLAQYDLKKFIEVLRKIQDNPHEFISSPHKYPYIMREVISGFGAYIKKSAISRKSDTPDMVQSYFRVLMYKYANHHRPNFR